MMKGLVTSDKYCPEDAQMKSEMLTTWKPSLQLHSG